MYTYMLIHKHTYICLSKMHFTYSFTICFFELILFEVLIYNAKYFPIRMLITEMYIVFIIIKRL